MNRRTRGFTLIEAMVVVAIIGILGALSYSYLRPLPPRSRLSSGARQLTAQMAAASSQARARDFRVVMLINSAAPVGSETRFRHWSVIDPWSTLDESMANNTAWLEPSDLVPVAPAPAGSVYRVLDSQTMEPNVGLPADIASGSSSATTSFRGAVAREAFTGGSFVQYPQCSGSDFGVTSGTALLAQGGFFPPPFCMVPVGGCSFCTSGRGAVVFEPDGQIKLLDHEGTRNALGVGSISLTAANITDVASVVLTSAGLTRAF